MCVNVCNVLDLDPDESAINFGMLDTDPHWECRPKSGSRRAKKTYKKENSKKFHVA